MQNQRPFGKDAPVDDPGATMADSEQEEASPEEQATFDLVVARAIKLFHGKGRDKTLKMLSSGETPADSIGRTAAMTVRMIEKSAQQAGKPIADDILYHAGIEIVEELFEYGVEAGIFQFSDQQEAQEQHDQALFYAMKYYGEQGLAEGDIDQDEMRRMMDQGVQQEQRARVGGAVREAMAEPNTPPQGAGIARSKGGMINAMMGDA